MLHKEIGNYGLFLHAHLPYVLHHGRWPQGSEWLCEAAAETYLPLLEMFDELIQEGFHPKITMDISPVLAEQLSASSFKNEMSGFLNSRIQTAQKNQLTFLKEKNEPFHYLAQRWEEHYKRLLQQFSDRFNRDLIAAFRKLQDQGFLEIITCAATHGYLPLLSQDTSIQAQIKIAIKTHIRHFHQPPAGIWLPECGYRPGKAWIPPVETNSKKSGFFRKGIEDILRDNQIKYFIYHATDAASNSQSTFSSYNLAAFDSDYSNPEFNDQLLFSPYEPVQVTAPDSQNSGVAAFMRDAATSLQVWSATTGYPGDEWYLEFHRKHFDGGLRYWRITGRNPEFDQKEIYEPGKAAGRYEEQANHFLACIKSRLGTYYEQKGQPGFLLTPFDAELFGHWWFEGPSFLKSLLKKVEFDPDIQLQTCSENLANAAALPSMILKEGSWGDGGGHKTWLNPDTAWLWEKLYAAEDHLHSFFNRIDYRQNSKLEELLKQAVRELLLLQSSDWPFLISTGTGKAYAEQRFLGHFEAFMAILAYADKYQQNGDLAYHEWLNFHHYQLTDMIFSDLELEWINNQQ
jgi:1,4-alpha-glucan branching enzyme